MSAGRLQFDNLPAATMVNPGEIEVPKGEHHFQISSAGEYSFHLRVPGSKLRVSGSFEVIGTDEPYLITKTIHHAPHTQAETVVRTVVKDAAKPHFEGLIIMEPPAQDSQSFLDHRALLIGSNAKSWALPSLEILANQVKCSHSAVVTTITDSDLFYLRSRGLSREESEDLLITTFSSL
jgi:Fe-S cluster assembly protein SufD